MTDSQSVDVGLALSGGGSRAAAFHRGTLRALGELGLVDRIKTVSSVSGGSVFAAAWLAAKARKQSDTEFLGWLHDVLRRGFIRPSLLQWRVISLLWKSRTRLIADTFDRLLFDGLGWADLPAAPLLCLNTTVLNNASTGRFSQDGYSSAGVGERRKEGFPVVTIAGLTLGFATAASAAFPFGLPPLSVDQGKFSEKFVGPLARDSRLVLTDGGILENLGIERLLQSAKFGTRHVIVSDAGARDGIWRPTLAGRLKGAAIYALSSNTLDRLLLVMNNKQNRSMRQLLFERFHGEPANLARSALFIRLENDWAAVLGGLPRARLAELGVDEDSPPQDIEAALAAAGCDLGVAKAIYTEMGGDTGALDANAVTTGFSGLKEKTLHLLELHARWQVHAMVALHGRPS